MANIESRNSILPLKNLNLSEVILGEFDETDVIELTISIADEHVNIKELSSYLDFIYWIDGNINKLGFASYSQMPRVQLEIARFQRGSWEIIIEKLASSEELQSLTVLYLLLKYLPSVIKAGLDGTYRYYEIIEKREDYFEKRNKRKFRSPLKQVIYEDRELEKVETSQLDKLYKFLSPFYSKNRNVAASRFAMKFVSKITIKPRKKADDNEK